MFEWIENVAGDYHLDCNTCNKTHAVVSQGKGFIYAWVCIDHGNSYFHNSYGLSFYYQTVEEAINDIESLFS